MSGNLQIILLTFVGVFLLWLGYTLFSHIDSPPRSKHGKRPSRPDTLQEGVPGAPRTCPVCSVILKHGERVRSSAFPSMDGRDRLMHVMGCPYCLDGQYTRKRVCPVCGGLLAQGEYLIARMFERPGRSHVHVLGCSRCRGPRTSR